MLNIWEFTTHMACWLFLLMIFFRNSMLWNIERAFENWISGQSCWINSEWSCTKFNIWPKFMDIWLNFEYSTALILLSCQRTLKCSIMTAQHYQSTTACFTTLQEHQTLYKGWIVDCFNAAMFYVVFVISCKGIP